MAANRQLSYDFRDIDLSSTDYTTELGSKLFLVYVGGEGDVKIHNTVTNTAVTFTAVSADRTLEFYTNKVYKTGTTATNLKAIY